MSEKKVLQQQVTDALRRVKAQQDNLLEVEADVTDGSRTVSPTTEDPNVKITTLAAGETVTVNAGTRLIIPGKNGSLSIPIPESMVEDIEDEGPEDPKEGSDDSNEYRHFPLVALHREPWQDDEAFEATLSAIIEVIRAMPKGMTLYFYVSPELDSITLTLGIYNGSLVGIEAQLRKAIAGVELLERRISKSDTKKRFASIYVTLLAHLGDILYEQGDYLRAREVFEQCWQVSIEQENVRQQVLTGARIGAFERNQGEYLRAQSYLDAALKASQVLGEPLAEAQIWQQLGLLEETQKKWSEAERCYREDLILQEQASSQEGIIASYSNLGKLQKEIGRFDEAEGWYKRALEMAEQTPDQIPFICNNFAAVLLEAVEAGHFPMARLAESRKYAEQALALYETATELAPLWTPLLILTRIASLMGDKEAERNLLRRSREAYIVPKENRDHVDWEFGWIIQAVAMAVTGSEQMQTILETNMPLFEKQRFILAKAIQHILAGEREWHILSEEMSGEDALITLRILETIRGENDKVIKFWLIDE